MSVIVSQYVPKNKFEQFHEILCATGGRYLSNPVHMTNEVWVNYEAGDYTAQQDAWYRLQTPIKEVDNTGVLKRFVRRLKVSLFFWK